MVGSWGRHTAINGVSDLDMIYILPASMKEDLHKEGGTSKALCQTKDAIAAHYSQTDIRVDRLVVVVQFRNYKFEVQPCFERSDGSFEYPDTYSDTWKRTDPRAEIEAISNLNENTGGKARNLCRLARAWKRKHNVDMGGLLIDTLVWRFFTSTSNTNGLTTHYNRLVLDFFRFLAELPKQQTWNALGSNQKVKVKKNFQAKARKAFNLCEEAIAGEGTASMPAKWRKVFGRFIPTTFATNSIEETEPYNDTEEFIEDLYPTLLSMAGIKHYHVPQTIDGEDITPILRGRQQGFEKRQLVWNYPNIWDGEGLGISLNCAIRPLQSVSWLGAAHSFCLHDSFRPTLHRKRAWNLREYHNDCQCP